MKQILRAVLLLCVVAMLTACSLAEPPAPTPTPDPYAQVKERLHTYTYTLIRVTTMNTNSLTARVYTTVGEEVTDFTKAKKYTYEPSEEFIKLDLRDHAEYWYHVGDTFREGRKDECRADDYLLLTYDNEAVDFTIVIPYGLQLPED